MKRISLLSLGVVSVCVVAAISYTVARRTVLYGQTSEFADQKAGSHFSVYDRDNYPDLTYAAENSVKAVVNIEKTENVSSRRGLQQGYDPFYEFFGIPQDYRQQDESPRELRSGGSGVIISQNGYMVTNNHVVENASKLEVKLNDGRTFAAKLIGGDPTTDVALIKIEAENLPTLAFGDSDAMRLGEWVLAIGSPFDLQSTVTAGIVSAKARNLDVIPNQFRIESFIQTDAAVNPGNSGGALVNVKGELIGINTVIKSPTGSFAGYSFAIPSSIVKKVVDDIREYGVVQRAMLGVTFVEIDENFIEREGKAKGISEQAGVYVESVDPDGAAKAAGIMPGDIIIGIDGVKTDHSATLLEQIGRHRPNDKVKISLKRGSKMKQIEVILRNKAGKAELLARDYVDGIESLGGMFAEISDKRRKELKIDAGVIVTGINEGGILSKARIRRGFVITHINERRVSTISDLSKITAKITTIDGVYPDGRAASYSLVE